MIGEFGISSSELKNASFYYNYAYNSGYSGILDWGYNDKCNEGCDDHLADEGMRTIRDKVKVQIG